MTNKIPKVLGFWDLFSISISKNCTFLVLLFLVKIDRRRFGLEWWFRNKGNGGFFFGSSHNSRMHTQLLVGTQARASIPWFEQGYESLRGKYGWLDEHATRTSAVIVKIYFQAFRLLANTLRSQDLCKAWTLRMLNMYACRTFTYVRKSFCVFLV